MPFFEDMKEVMERGDYPLSVVVESFVWQQSGDIHMVQQAPWTMVRAKVWFNGVVFEGVGFARQRQYTSLVAHRTRRFPGFKVVLARSDKWNTEYGRCVAYTRAVAQLVKNVCSVYVQWDKGQLELAPKE